MTNATTQAVTQAAIFTVAHPQTGHQVGLTMLGINELDMCIRNGSLTPAAVLTLLDDRISKRKIQGKPLIPRVVQYRNSLAESIAATSGGTATIVPVPQFNRTQQAAALPSDPEQLADLVFSALGVPGSAAFIGRLTARITSA